MGGQKVQVNSVTRLKENPNMQENLVRIKTGNEAEISLRAQQKRKIL